jgi:hypothetical protein
MMEKEQYELAIYQRHLSTNVAVVVWTPPNNAVRMESTLCEYQQNKKIYSLLFYYRSRRISAAERSPYLMHRISDPWSDDVISRVTTEFSM